MNAKWKMIGSLFTTFLKMGPFTFGGGYALIPVIEREIVEKRKWLQSEDVADIVAVWHFPSYIRLDDRSVSGVCSDEGQS